MARPQSKEVHLYQKKGRPEWWCRFSLPPHVARSFRAPDELPDANRPPSNDGRVAFSLQTTDKRVANARALRLQARLTEAWEGKLNRQMVRTLLDDSGPDVLTLEQLVSQIERAEAEKLARWKPVARLEDRQRCETISPDTAARYQDQRGYFLEALAAVYPHQRFFVHQIGVRDDSRCDLRKIAAWLLDTRKLSRESYNSTRSYWSGYWQHLVCARGLADANPWRDKVMRPPERRAIPRATLDDQQRALVRAAPSSWANNALKLLLFTGSRPVELCHWMRNRYDATTNTWKIFMSKVDKDKDVANTEDVAAVVADQVRVLDALGLGSSLYLFPRYSGPRKGEPSTRRQMAKAVTRAIRKLVGAKTATGLSISSYVFRRTVATLRDRAGVSASGMATLLGHANTDQQEVYRQLDAQALHETARALQRKI